MSNGDKSNLGWFSKYCPYSKKWHIAAPLVVLFFLGYLSVLVLFIVQGKDLNWLEQLAAFMSGIVISALGSALCTVILHLTNERSPLIKKLDALDHDQSSLVNKLNDLNRAVNQFSPVLPLHDKAACHVKEALKNSKCYCFRAVTGAVVIPKLCMRDSYSLDRVYGCLLAPTWNNYHEFAKLRLKERKNVYTGTGEAKIVGEMFVEFFHTIAMLSHGKFPGKEGIKSISLRILTIPSLYIVDHFSNNGRGTNSNSMLVYDCQESKREAGGLEYYVFPGQRKMYDFWQEEFRFLFPDDDNLSPGDEKATPDTQEHDIIWIKSKSGSSISVERLRTKANEYFTGAINSLRKRDESEWKLVIEEFKAAGIINCIPCELPKDPLTLGDPPKPLSLLTLPGGPPKSPDGPLLRGCEWSKEELGSAGTGKAPCRGEIERSKCPIFAEEQK